MQPEVDTFVTSDGTRLSYQTVGHGPTVVLANGLGGTFHTWRHLYRHLAPRYRVVSWDFRGLHGSAAPNDPYAVTVAHHTNDARSLLAHLQVNKAAFIGWSMGVQLNFELYRRAPELFAGLVAINGTAGRAFESVRAVPQPARILPPLVDAFSRMRVIFNPLARWASAWPGTVPLLQRAGMVGPTIDQEIFEDVAAQFGKIDFGLYFRTLSALGKHDAWDVLPNIRVPTLVVAGDRDLMTPLPRSRRISRLIPGARLVVLPNTSHYAPIEQPALLNQALDQLFARLEPWS